jgi:hypothetical protein
MQNRNAHPIRVTNPVSDRQVHWNVSIKLFDSETVCQKFWMVHAGICWASTKDLIPAKTPLLTMLNVTERLRT